MTCAVRGEGKWGGAPVGCLTSGGVCLCIQSTKHSAGHAVAALQHRMMKEQAQGLQGEAVGSTGAPRDPEAPGPSPPHRRAMQARWKAARSSRPTALSDDRSEVHQPEKPSGRCITRTGQTEGSRSSEERRGEADGKGLQGRWEREGHAGGAGMATKAQRQTCVGWHLASPFTSGEQSQRR